MRNPFAQAQEAGALDEACGSLKLTRTQRLYGFGICFVVGFLISALSTLSLVTGNFTGFAILYTFGNIVSLLSTSFLTGFYNQFKKMFDSTRRVAAIVFWVTMILTFVVAFKLDSVGLCILFCIIQAMALFWYSASFIPFGRDMIRNCFRSAVGART
ncbi:hypothetical protein RI367_002888 [Sorochytrium milnesiophthora]